MNSPNYLQDLIMRMSDETPLQPGMSSAHSISFKALREAEKLEDPEILAQLKFMLPTIKVLKQRDSAYFAICSLAAKTKDAGSMTFVLQNLKQEKDKYLIASALDKLHDAGLPVDSEAETVVAFSRHSQWLVKFAAIRLLSWVRGEGMRKAAGRLEEVLAGEKEEGAWAAAARSLQMVGNAEAVPALKAMVVRAKKSDTLSAAFRTIGKLSGAAESAYFLAQMRLQRDAWVKTQLTRLLHEHAGAEAIPAMIERVRQILAQARKTNWIYLEGTRPELVDALEFLQKHAEREPEIRALFNWVKEKRMAFLDETEAKWVGLHL